LGLPGEESGKGLGERKKVSRGGKATSGNARGWKLRDGGKEKMRQNRRRGRRMARGRVVLGGILLTLGGGLGSKKKKKKKVRREKRRGDER